MNINKFLGKELATGKKTVTFFDANGIYTFDCDEIESFWMVGKVGRLITWLGIELSLDGVSRIVFETETEQEHDSEE